MYECIFFMCVDSCSVLLDYFFLENVNDMVKEICLNWFFKIVFIREFILRFYVEVFILKCNKFFFKMGILECLFWLICMIRGIGDLLVLVYVCVYLCWVGMEVVLYFKEILNKNFFDFFFMFK